MEKKKMRVWKKILIIIGIIVLIFAVRTVRNMIIIKTLDSRVSKYVDAKNVHITLYNYQGETVNVSESYQNGDKYLVEVNLNGDGHTRKLTNYCDGMTVNTYIESDGDKIAMLNSNGLPSVGKVTNYLEMENLWQFMVMSVCSNIKSENCNGKECYKISDLPLVSTVLVSESGDFSNSDFSIYIEKETGLMVRQFNGTVGTGNDVINTVADYKYEFDTVTDEDLVEPDISQYKIQEN